MFKKQLCPVCNAETWLSDSQPTNIELRGFEIIQKRRKFYVMKVSAQELDRLCWVPQIDPTLSNAELSRIALMPGLERWQRLLDQDRIHDIGEFFNSPYNLFVNSITIALPRSDIDLNIVDDQATIRIPVSWMKQRCNSGHMCQEGGVTYWFDRCPRHDCPEHTRDLRIGKIIDGQHRTRGTQHLACGSTNPIEPLVVTVLLEDEFPPATQAKIFTEITTAAEDLEPLHKCFLLYKFGMRGPGIQDIKVADFRTTTPIGIRNRRAYEISCNLNTTPGPWYERITILRYPGRGGRLRRGDVIEIPTIVAVLETWLKNGGVFRDPLQPDSMKNTLDAVSELNDYLRAILFTWQGIDFWNPGRGANGVLQERGIFYVILRLFEIFSRRIDNRGAQRSQAEFEDELRLISPISWDTTWTALEAPDRNIELLYRILKNKIQTAPQVGTTGFTQDATLNAYITQSPDAFDWDSTTLALSGQQIRHPVTLRWEQPVNAYTTATIQILRNNTPIEEFDVVRSYFELEPSSIQSRGNVTLVVLYENHRGVTRVSTPINVDIVF